MAKLCRRLCGFFGRQTSQAEALTVPLAQAGDSLPTLLQSKAVPSTEKKPDCEAEAAKSEDPVQLAELQVTELFASLFEAEEVQPPSDGEPPEAADPPPPFGLEPHPTLEEIKAFRTKMALMCQRIPAVYLEQGNVPFKWHPYNLIVLYYEGRLELLPPGQRRDFATLQPWHQMVWTRRRFIPS
eukprot:TRINITY_DN22654_c0_g1_i1.p1 TRINITY_DN22654_c0_g1~~TRINITY_DN22654_c0_g1_i1.p1  ORF type:complete len:184 (+),score=44.04 TRINITY_DN22654_c0_g1_i1:58-609(+)